MREKSLFIATLASPAGVVSSYAVAAIVSSKWQLNFLISAIGLVAFALIWEITVASLKVDMVECEAVEEREIYQKKLDGSFAKTVIKSGLIFVFALTFIRAMFDFGIKGMTPTMIKESYEAVTPVLATILNIAVLLSGVFGIVLAHIIYPRFIKNESVAVVMFFCGSLPLMVLCILIGRINYWIMIALLSLIVMFMSSVSLFTTSYIAAKFNRYGKGATVAGILNAMASLGIVVAYTLFPGLADFVGWKMTIVAWMVILAIAAVLSFMFLVFWSQFLKKYNRE
jgi:MFS family permease